MGEYGDEATRPWRILYKVYRPEHHYKPTIMGEYGDEASHVPIANDNNLTTQRIIPAGS